MFKKLLVCFLVLVTVGFYVTKVFAYSPDTTHAALTQEIVEFYNLLYPDRKLSQEETEWFMALMSLSSSLLP